ncbi:uncharacterized protein TNCV_626671 [Trichonephila clavipes]|nr:uncharacterized protein TNCV_626671 [Trichonephila clavipes]
MAPGSRCMSGNTCGCKILWTYHWVVMVPRINTRGNRVLLAMAPHTITPALGAVCRSVQFPRARHHSKRKHRWLAVKARTRNGRHDPKCPSARRLRMVREDTGVCYEVPATSAWVVADEVVGCKHAFLTMWWSSQRLVCRRQPEPGLRVNDISRILWSQHLLTTQSERPN